ncbi:MAG: HAD family hydrolase [Deltaproteobacteria bacterium]|nr:HAD family hydrolase [Deltaproteobacteria bacterium]
MTTPAKPRAILFDLDGTLLDSLDSIADAMNATLRDHEFPTHPREAYRAFVGDGVRALAERVVPAESHGALDEILATFKEHYRHTREFAPPYPGILAMLEIAKASGISIGVLTNKPDDSARVVVAKQLGSVGFEHVRGDRPDEPRKPDPAGALALAEAMKVPPAKCWIVGDTPTDLKTAAAAGMVGVGVLWGFRSREELSAEKHRILVESPAELGALLAKKTKK